MTSEVYKKYSCKWELSVLLVQYMYQDTAWHPVSGSETRQIDFLLQLLYQSVSIT